MIRRKIDEFNSHTDDESSLLLSSHFAGLLSSYSCYCSTDDHPDPWGVTCPGPHRRAAGLGAEPSRSGSGTSAGGSPPAGSTGTHVCHQMHTCVCHQTHKQARRGAGSSMSPEGCACGLRRNHSGAGAAILSHLREEF